MRLNDYLNEENIGVSYEQLKKDCSKYLKTVKSGMFLYRGSKKIVTNKPIIPRIDRKPRDTQENYHIFLDKMFYKKFGWKARSEGVFVTSELSLAEKYGAAYYFFPFDGYKFIWNRYVNDLYATLKDDILYGYSNLNEREFIKLTQELIDDYQNDNLQMAFNKKVEISFKCKAYYLSKTSYAELIKNDKDI